MNDMQPGKIKSANIHVYGGCNYRCEHCFSRSLTRSYMEPREWARVLEDLKTMGIEKINIAGGEPMLYPHLDELCHLVKGMGFTLSIVSNGSLITEGWISGMKGIVDWIGLSVDSPSDGDEILIGRHMGGLDHIENIVNVSGIAHRHGIRVKLNITVVRRSWMKDFKPLVSAVRSERVKAFRALTLRNANDDVPDVWSITDGQFADFVKRYEGTEGMVFEDNDDMIGSYLMFDPIGRLMINKDGVMRFVPYDVFIREGMGPYVDADKYLSRGAVYRWGSK